MWPVLLNMTRDECRLTLRRLELEAYSNMIDVFRAQGTLEDSRKKLLEELRAVLHISQDRHSAEARRVSNDQLLATIAEKLSGPNTGLGWICEGRRRIPLLPRGVPQTAYTEIADQVAEKVAAENKELQKRLAAEKQEKEDGADTETATEETLSSNDMEESPYPIAMEDQTLKLWETELLCRKRKPESSIVDDTAPPVKNMRNIPVNTNQKHLNLSQIYSKFSQPATSKPPGQSKHSYNQVSKVSTSKSSQAHAPRSTPHKQRAPKAPKTPKTQTKSKKLQSKSQELVSSPSKQYPSSLPLEYAGPPNTFQASYAQSVLGGKLKMELVDDTKPKVMSTSIMTDSPTMQLLTQPATLPHELEVSENAHPDDPSSLQAQSTPVKQSISGKPSHLVLHNRGDIVSEKKLLKGEMKAQHKPETIKLLSNRQVMLAPSTPQKTLNTPGKLITTKVIGSLPTKTRPSNTPVQSEKLIVVSKPAASESRTALTSKIVMTSSTPIKERPVSTNTIPRIVESLTPKGIPTTDLKVSAKAVVLNQKSGQKMVVVPAKPRPKQEAQLPLLHFKGLSTSMKLLPVGSQSISQIKSSPVTVVSRPSTMSSNTKLIGMEPIKTANLADIVPVKGLTPMSTTKITNPIVRPSSAKGNVIVVQKGSNLGKALSFAKNGNDMSKIIMGKNVTQLLQASKSDTDAAKTAGNVIVLELNNEQPGRPTTMSEILDSRATSTPRVTAEKKVGPITQDTPVLFDNQITEETCNTNSMDSTVESISGITQMEDSGLSIIGKDVGKSGFSKDSDGAKDSSSVTDWEMELDTVVTRKDKDDDDKLNSMHLDLGMSSDSDNEYMATGRKKSKQEIQQATTSGESGGVYSSSSAMSLATRTLLSQLQDDGSSSNDSSFALRAKIAKLKDDCKLDKTESDELTKAKEKLSEKVAEARSQQRRIDIYSTAITPSDINLESFAYLDEGMMADDVVFADEAKREARREQLALEEQLAREARPDQLALDDQLARLLAEDSPRSTDSHTVSENMPLTK